VTRPSPRRAPARRGFTCNANTVRCNPGKDACEKILWTFDDSAEGWHSNGADDRADDGNVASSANRAHTGSRSLRAVVNLTGLRNYVRLAYWPCGRASYTQDGPEAMNVHNKSIRFWVYIDAAGAPATGHECGGGGYAKNDLFGYNEPRVSVPANQWTLVTTRFPEAVASAATFLDMSCRLAGTNWSGSVYFDDARID
jgi:hypothetical protein